MDDLISRRAAIDALRTCYDTETISMDNGDEYINYGDAVGEIEQLPSAEPEHDKPVRLSTVCLRCGKPAVTFRTDDDIPYTNYSYCEDCLRKGLKLLRKLPSAEPQERTGRWIDETFKPWGLVHHPYRCNLCGEHAEYDSMYCPNCGARMEVDNG